MTSPFLAAEPQGEVNEEDVEAVRGLYAGEVDVVEEHLAWVLDALETTAQRDDPLILVPVNTAGTFIETDVIGRRNMDD